MTVGINSYVSLDEANDYITGWHGGTHEEDTWDTKTDSQKDLLLMTACADLDGLPFVGRKTDTRQDLMFPRYPSKDVPQSIKAAQVEIALLPLYQDGQTSAFGAAQRAALQRQGVVSYSLGDLSESYGGIDRFLAEYPFMASEIIYHLLKRFLSGGYAIC